jgi:hypothetical protein
MGGVEVLALIAQTVGSRTAVAATTVQRYLRGYGCAIFIKVGGHNIADLYDGAMTTAGGASIYTGIS